MQMKYEKNNEWENLYPTTISSNVIMLDGRKLEEWKNNLDDEMNELANRTIDVSANLLWGGADVLTTTIITPSKNLSDCFTGYLFVFGRKTGTVGVFDNYNYYHLSKGHLHATNSGTASGVKVVLGTTGNGFLQKYIYVKNREVKGHSLNGTNGNETMELIAIYEY